MRPARRDAPSAIALPAPCPLLLVGERCGARHVGSPAAESRLADLARSVSDCESCSLLLAVCWPKRPRRAQTTSRLANEFGERRRRVVSQSIRRPPSYNYRAEPLPARRARLAGASRSAARQMAPETLASARWRRTFRHAGISQATHNAPLLALSSLCWPTDRSERSAGTEQLADRPLVSVTSPRRELRSREQRAAARRPMRAEPQLANVRLCAAGERTGLLINPADLWASCRCPSNGFALRPADCEAGARRRKRKPAHAAA